MHDKLANNVGNSFTDGEISVRFLLKVSFLQSFFMLLSGVVPICPLGTGVVNMHEKKGGKRHRHPDSEV